MSNSNRGKSGNGNLAGEIRVGWKMAAIGMEIASVVAAGALLGWGFDKWQGTDPKGITIGAIIGIIVGMWTLIYNTLKLNRQLDRQHPTRGRGEPIPYPEDEDDDDDAWKDSDDDWPKPTARH